MRRFILLITCLLLSASFAWSISSNKQRRLEEQAAKAVIDHFSEGQIKVKVRLSLSPNERGCDSYHYYTKGNVLIVEASSGVAACRGFYDYVKEKKAGICSWSGNRFVRPADLQTEGRYLTSNYRDHQYMNVVTYGYTCPYWDEARWDKEIDWMALHGIDMPLVLVGAEQVYREVFMDMGLTSEEIDAWEVGPAHLPWFRMGNLAGNSFDGPLGKEWNIRQEALCKHILKRMRQLGMKPICPAFGGFVPQAFTQHYPGTTDLTGWNWVPKTHRNYRLSPHSSTFVEVGKRFIQKWEEKYGEGKYYLSDSFNEMEIPNDLGLLTQYGDSIYKTIKEGSSHPEAVWVTQGWTFVFQQNAWGAEKFDALTRNIPDHNFMVLYMSPEYGGYGNKTWEAYNSFNHKDWCYTLLPNMGGKNTMTGRIDDYALHFPKALNASTNKASLTGYGMTPEGVENNEMLYELITDAGWQEDGAIDLDSWCSQYALCRYGIHNKALQDYHHALRQSVYGYFTDHPRYGWQVGTNLTGQGTARQSKEFYQGVENLLSASFHTDLSGKQQVSLLQADLIEAVALYCAGKIELLNQHIGQAIGDGHTTLADTLISTLDQLMLDLDAILTLHPLYNLAVWEEKAMLMADDEATKKRNAVNARRLVTIWYGDHTYDEPVQDYSARLWAGIVRDYYRPRLIQTWKAKLTGEKFDRIAWEKAWVERAPYLTTPKALTTDITTMLRKLLADVQKAVEIGDFDTNGNADSTPNHTDDSETRRIAGVEEE